MKYVVSVKEVNYGAVTVEANSPEQAKELAEQEYYGGNVYWDNSDIDYLNVQKKKSYER